jgi:hypothetical protein
MKKLILALLILLVASQTSNGQGYYYEYNTPYGSGYQYNLPYKYGAGQYSPYGYGFRYESYPRYNPSLYPSYSAYPYSYNYNLPYYYHHHSYHYNPHLRRRR